MINIVLIVAISAIALSLCILAKAVQKSIIYSMRESERLTRQVEELRREIQELRN